MGFLARYVGLGKKETAVAAPEKKDKLSVPKKNRHTIHLPLKIPQNIINTLQDYWDWRDNQEAYPKGRKQEILETLEKICRQWHLFAGFEAMAGTFFIYTTCGVTINASSIKYRKPPYRQATNGFDELWDNQEPLTENIINGHYYRYIWDKEDSNESNE